MLAAVQAPIIIMSQNCHEAKAIGCDRMPGML